MPHAYCFFSFRNDADSLAQSIRSIRASDPTARIAVFDDGHAPLAKPPRADYFERTWFNRRGNLNGRECIMGELLAFQKAARLFGAERLAKIDSDTVVVDAARAFALPASVHADLYGASWHDQGVWGPFYILSTAFVHRMLEAINSQQDLPDEEDFGMTRLARAAHGRVTIVPWADKFLNGFDYRLKHYDFERFRSACAITCGNRMQIDGPEPRGVQARAMEGLIDYLLHNKPFDWAQVLDGHKVFNAVDDPQLAAVKKNETAVSAAAPASPAASAPASSAVPPPPPEPEVCCATNRGIEVINRPSVSVVVIGRNAAPFLRECLASIEAQTLKPDEWVFVDDASSDDSARITRRFKGLKTKRLWRNRGMCGARMAGVEMTTGALMLFVDSDNVLPPDYLATMVEDLGARYDFAYPAKEFFGDVTTLAHRRRWHPNDRWQPPEANRARLWNENYADTCSLVRRDAFLAAGAWRPNPADTMFDWDLFLRMSARGGHVRSRAKLRYRVHTDNWSERERGNRDKLVSMVRRHAASITVAAVWSGRIPELTRPWLKAIAAALRKAGKIADLLIMDDSAKSFPLRELQALGKEFNGVSIRRIYRGLTTAKRRPDRRATAEFLAPACNEILASARGDIVWFIEDDVIVPENAADELLRAMLETPDSPHVAVAGCYRSRHRPDHWIAAHVQDRRVIHLAELPVEPVPVHFTGTGCLMVLRDLLGGIRFGTEWNHNGLRSSAHDWVFAWQLHEQGTPIRILPSIVCRHHMTDKEWV